MNNLPFSLDSLPLKVVYSARAIIGNRKIMKNRNGKQSKLQSALGRLAPHIAEDEVAIIISVRDLKAAMLTYAQKQEPPEFTMEYTAKWIEEPQKATPYTVDETLKSYLDDVAFRIKENDRGSVKAKAFLESLNE